MNLKYNCIFLYFISLDDGELSIGSQVSTLIPSTVDEDSVCGRNARADAALLRGKSFCFKNF